MNPVEHETIVGRLRRRLWVERSVFGLAILLLGAGYVLPVGDDGGAPVPDSPQAPERYAITVKGTVLGAADTERAAREALDRVKAGFAALLPELAEEPSFKDEVRVVRRPVSDALYRPSVEGLADLLRRSASGAPTHTVAPGDTGWRIARQAGITLEELQSLNPGRNLDRLDPGDQVRVGKAPDGARLTVLTREVATVRTPIPPPLLRVRSPRMYRGKQIVVLPGSRGIREVVETRSYENGVLSGVEIQSARVVRQPSLRKVVVGDLPRP